MIFDWKKLYIFDFDGTIFDSVDDVIVCFNKSLSLNGFPILTRDEYIACLGGNIDELTSLILGENSTQENIDLIKNTYKKVYTEYKKENTAPFKGIKNVLEKLQDENIILAINSNRKTYSINYFVDKYLPSIDFVSVEGYCDENPSKPDPAGVNKIIEKVGVDLNEVVYIGDSYKDIETARNAGIDCVIVKWGYGNSDDYKNPYILKAIDNVDDILSLFNI